ncbi:3-oxoacid CoA-transferase subunit B [Bacteriovorax sp. Seq25_V]|uniref:3-oxoacid CoA-transferase subunit B n=1 Tax=Bacteriovorax sp. Seq25_V TaxID=1201288 RepID=UPI000389FD07|nr:3-oxoacid CoA-transferase subunit B [Bacteriovorax sp. Seq25_V]EQC44275.1 3-oxoacid CoA-transferase, B subunit [Bacteriovorax sp. Seq25_V]
MSWSKIEMAKEALNLIPKGSSINLGIGLPTLISEILPKEHDYIIHSENGVLGVGQRPSKNEVSPTLINAGKETISVIPGASFFDSSTSFGMIRGGHIDYCILGGMEVDSERSLANWMIPGKKITGMGGAMDLVNGAKNVIVMMTHKNKDDTIKLVKKCTLPLTGKAVVNTVVTDLGVFSFENEKFKVLKLVNGVTLNDLGSNELFVE